MKNCLIVDDSNSIRKVTARILEALDFKVVEADNESSALGTCEAEMPDCVIVDWQVPDMDSLRFLKMLRGMRDGDRPKIVYCLSENDPMTVAKAVRHGADGYLLKPFDRDLLKSSFAAVGLL
jgi:two-component system chemotaxis response regulator CheY